MKTYKIQSEKKEPCIKSCWALFIRPFYLSSAGLSWTTVLQLKIVWFKRKFPLICLRQYIFKQTTERMREEKNVVSCDSSKAISILFIHSSSTDSNSNSKNRIKQKSLLFRITDQCKMFSSPTQIHFNFQFFVHAPNFGI